MCVCVCVSSSFGSVADKLKAYINLLFIFHFQYNWIDHVLECVYYNTQYQFLPFSSAGGHVSQLKYYSQQLESFHAGHPVGHSSEQETFNERLLSWHRDFKKLHDDIHLEFDIVWADSSFISLCSLLLYIVSERESEFQTCGEAFF